VIGGAAAEIRAHDPITWEKIAKPVPRRQAVGPGERIHVIAEGRTTTRAITDRDADGRGRATTAPTR
jgi:hypothetical protein